MTGPSGAAVDALLRLAGAGAVGVLVLLVLRRAPRLAFAGWLAVLCCAPVWAGVTVVVHLEPQVLTGLVVLAALFPLRRSLPVRLTAGDLVVGAFVVSALVPVVLGGATVSGVFVLLGQWTGAFLLGRLIGHRVPLPWVHGAVAVAFTGVAVLALAEWATGWNPFLAVPGAGGLYDTWAPVQERGGVARAEGAFGHSIALGGSLALALPITLAAPFRPALRLGAAVLMLAACAVTFSRIGLGTAVLGVLLTLVFLRGDLVPARLRWWLVGGLLAGTAAVAPLVLRVFDAAGGEATGSAAYRADLVALLADVRLLGLSPLYDRSPTGEVSFGGFRSIDSTVVLLGLTYGWIPLLCVVAGVLLAVGAVVSGRAGPPTVALVAQLPALATVALITQYSGWLWFVVGLAVASHALPRDTDGTAANRMTAAEDAPNGSVVVTHSGDFTRLRTGSR